MKLKVRAKDASSIARMNIFLRTVEDTVDWDAAAAATLYEDPPNRKSFKEISIA
jgi:hypothetical protein